MSDWRPPEPNTYVECGDRCLPVPVIDPDVVRYILDTLSDIDRLASTIEVLKWMRSLSDDEVHAGCIYFTEQWTWDNGHYMDRFLMNVLERELRHRKELQEAIDLGNMPPNYLHDVLDHIVDEIRAREDSGD